MLNIAHNIQQLRIEAGMTQESLAHYLGLTKATVSKWENRISYPDIRYLPVLASLFNTTVDQLLGYQNQLDRKQIGKLHGSLVSKVNEGNFDEIIDEIKQLFKKYINDHQTVLMLAQILINHCQLKPESVQQTIELATQYLNRIITHSDAQHLIQQAIFFKASCFIIVQQYEEVIELLKERPYKLGDELLLANSYLLTGQHKEASKVIQVEMYQQLIIMLSHINMMIHFQLREDTDELIARGRKLIDCFDVNHLHPSTALNFNLLSAKYYAAIDESKTIYFLKQYYRNCKTLINDYYLHGDAFFDQIDDWLKSTPTGITAPIDKENVKSRFVEVVRQLPEFKNLEHNQDFKNICYQLEQLNKE